MISSRPVGPQQLFLALQDRIERGVYAAGAWLPAEREMAQEFGLDRSAVRRVLLQLEEQGLIVREAGKRPWVQGGRAPRQGAGDGAGRPADAGLRTIVAILPQHPIYPASLAILPRIDAFRPDLIVISAGFDAHRLDPLANINLGESDFAWVTARMMDLADKHCQGRVVSLLEGGYDLEGLGRSVAAHVLTLMGHMPK